MSDSIVDLSDVNDFADELAATAAYVRTQAPREVSKVARQVFTEAHANAPVDTGELQGSVYLREEDGAWRIGSDKKQGFFQEFGTSEMPAQPWLFRAARDVPRTLAGVLGQLGGVLRGRGGRRR